MIKLLVSTILLISIFSSSVNALIRPNFYYRVNWENINCIRAPCPQYSAQKVNTNENPTAISSIIYPAGFNNTYLDKEEARSLIVFGSIQPNPDFPNEAKDLKVVRVYKALPLGNSALSSDKYYIFNDNGIRCITTPCFSTNAVLLNVHTKQSISDIIQPYAKNVGKYFDSAWLASKTIRTDDFGLIGQGTIDSGKITISNSFINLPDPSGKCGALPLLKCQGGSMTTYSRNENRCLTSPTCTTASFCTLGMPLCPVGYRLDQFSSTEAKGCPKYFCDPVFVLSWKNVQCFVPPCPQYSIEKINTNEKSQKILDFIYPNGLNKTFLIGEQSKSLIVLGSTQPSSKFPNNATDFLVKRVYKSLPLGNNETSTDKFYIFGDNGVRCKNAPCPSITAVLLNTHTQETITTINQPYSKNVGFFDSVWLSSKNIRSDDFGLIGQGTIKSGVISISNSFIYLPDPPIKCPELPLLDCVEGHSTTYSRDENRCLTSPKCTKLGVCTLSIPLCNKGYRLDSFPSTELNGCPKFYCDPEFVDKTH
ncbi:hypothetical protein RB653_002208 [Dictyostelium firmibasis]|uniref:DUF6748 domain-containing protein n=1 Tax=Dictyostelium firmibasis TaxID=79012 RepID=A0AAN7YVG1_9MYCE